MEIKRLKKKLMKEELKRRYPNRIRNRWICGIVTLSLVAGGVLFYFHQRDEMLETRFEKALTLMHQDQFESAAQAFDAVYRKRPGSKLAPRALFNRGEILNNSLKRYKKALICYLQLIKQYPQSNLALRSQKRVAEIYKYRLQNNSSAIVAYQNLLDMGAADRAGSLYEIADSYFKLNNFEQARIEFQSFLKKHPDSQKTTEVTYRIGVCLYIEGKLEESEELLRGVIETWPDAPYTVEARFTLGEVLEEQEKLKESLRIFEDLRGTYSNRDALEKKITQVSERIRKKKKAI